MNESVIRSGKISIYLYWGPTVGTWSEVSCNEDIRGLVKEGSGEGLLSP